MKQIPKPEVWQEVLRPTLTEEKVEYLPLGIGNWFYDLWQQADEEVKDLTTTIDNPAIDPKEVEAAKDEVGCFCTRIHGRIYEAGQGLFKQEWFI